MTPIHDPCPGGGGGGDAFLAATQTWTGVNTYNGKTNFNDLVVVSGTAEAIAGGSELWFKPTGPSGTPFDTDQYRLRILGTGEMLWGNGAGPSDISIGRGSGGTLNFTTNNAIFSNNVVLESIQISHDGGINGRNGSLATETLINGAVIGDAEERYRVKRSGLTQWGDGTNPVDTSLARAGIAALATNGEFTANAGAPTEVRIGTVGGVAGIQIGSGGTNWYKAAGDTLKTDGEINVQHGAFLANAGPIYSVSFYGAVGASQAAAIAAPSTPSVVYSQAEAQSAVDAINFLIAALGSATGVGLTA